MSKPGVVRIVHEVFVDLDDLDMVDRVKQDMHDAIADGVIQPEVTKLKKKEITKEVLKEIEENIQPNRGGEADESTLLARGMGG